MTFPMTELRAPIRTRDKIDLAAATVASIGRMRDPRGPKHAHIRAAHTIDRTRLKTPWLTVYPSTFTTQGEWKTWTRTVIRFYLNAPAHHLIFPKKQGIHLPKAAYLSLNREHDALAVSWRKGGFPATIRPNASAYFSHTAVAADLVRLRYLIDGEATYFPIRQTDVGLIADLSTAYSKADAIAHEEDLCGRG